MLPLRYPWLWAALGWSLVAAVCIGSLLPSDVVGDYRVSDKFAHAAAYFALMVWFAGLYPRRAYVIIAVGLVALGAAIELAQSGLATRHFDIADMAANAIGIVLGLGLSWTWLAGWCQRVERRWFN